MPTRIVIVTGSLRGTAANCLPALIAHPGVVIAGVLHANGSGTSRWRTLRRKAMKILRIGPLGAWNGKRIRTWFHHDYGNLRDLCHQSDVPFFEVIGLNSREMMDRIKSLKPDLGVSLGNGYIAPRVFELPRLGMINLHSEILPAYQNAQCIIWPIYFNDPCTGFTIHEIERKIDAGRILYQRKYPLRFFPSLEETVRWNKTTVERDIPAAVAEVCANIEIYKGKAIPQGAGGCYTTPSIWQFWRMVRNNSRFYRSQQRGTGK